VNILKRGYSITFFEGKVLKDFNTVGKTDIITTKLSNGTVTSIVEDTQPEENRE
jgi:exodeoxyribonuclease VII large subunit